jgi:hypothetical protein
MAVAGEFEQLPDCRHACRSSLMAFSVDVETVEAQAPATVFRG